MSIEEKYDEVRQLINIGKEKGYLLYDEVNELLPSEITSSDELDDLFNTFGSAGSSSISPTPRKVRLSSASSSPAIPAAGCGIPQESRPVPRRCGETSFCGTGTMWCP